MSRNRSLDGKAIVIAGAGGTLGPELTRVIAEEGAVGLVIGDRDEDALVTATESIRSATPCYQQLTDVTVLDQMDALVQVAMERFGRVDVLINNAGVLAPSARIHNTDVDDWQRSFSVNVLGSVNGIKSALKVMRPAGHGAIINTASVAGLTTWPYAGPYSATKAAVIQLTKIAAVEYAADGLRVNCVCPGVFPSAMHEGLSDDAMDSLSQRHPLGLGTPADVVGAYVYLASDQARWVTGTALVVDGGYAQGNIPPR